MDRISELRRRSVDPNDIEKKIRKRKTLVAIFWLVVLIVVGLVLFS